MMISPQEEHTELIPVDAVTVINPRVRNQKVFDEIVANIAELGLKRPITVASRETGPDEPPAYELVCGQGRLEAFKALGQKKIPAVVITASSEDCLVMSLVENLARRKHHSLDLLRDIRRLKDSGYTEREIAGKTQLSRKYVHGVLRLLESQEHRLLRAVESGKIRSVLPLTLPKLMKSACRLFSGRPMKRTSCAAAALWPQNVSSKPGSCMAKGGQRLKESLERACPSKACSEPTRTTLKRRRCCCAKRAQPEAKCCSSCSR